LAGDDATASAVIADLIDIIKGTLSRDVLGWQSLEATPYQNQNDIESIFYLRLLATDKPGVLADITAIFADHNISVAGIFSKRISGVLPSPKLIKFVFSSTGNLSL
jgi:homoserine dehydrogenase